MYCRDRRVLYDRSTLIDTIDRYLPSVSATRTVVAETKLNQILHRKMSPKRETKLSQQSFTETVSAQNERKSTEQGRGLRANHRKNIETTTKATENCPVLPQKHRQSELLRKANAERPHLARPWMTSQPAFSHPPL